MFCSVDFNQCSTTSDRCVNWVYISRVFVLIFLLSVKLILKALPIVWKLARYNDLRILHVWYMCVIIEFWRDCTVKFMLQRGMSIRGNYLEIPKQHICSYTVHVHFGANFSYIRTSTLNLPYISTQKILFINTNWISWLQTFVCIFTFYVCEASCNHLFASWYFFYNFCNTTRVRGLSDKFDWSMTRGELLDNIPRLVISYFYSNDV